MKSIGICSSSALQGGVQGLKIWGRLGKGGVGRGGGRGRGGKLSTHN